MWAGRLGGRGCRVISSSSSSLQHLRVGHFEVIEAARPSHLSSVLRRVDDNLIGLRGTSAVKGPRLETPKNGESVWSKHLKRELGFRQFPFVSRSFSLKKVIIKCPVSPSGL